MAKENIYQSLEVFYEKVNDCPLRDRQFNFFELIYVLSGTGKHTVNGNQFIYSRGDLFLITPNDYHEFDLNEVCEFMVIRFEESYVREYHWKSINHIEYLLYYASHLSGSILSNKKDQEMIGLLMQNLRFTIENKSMFDEDLLPHLVNAILVIAARNIAVIRPQNIIINRDNRIVKILDYIQTNIYNPELLKIAIISEKFGLSPNYLGSFFRQQCHESIQQYISSYRIKLIEHRLCFSDKRIHEIADEFGFSDESHINKFFKRHKNMSLKAYRQN